MITESFKVSPTTLATEILKMWLERNYWMLVVPPAACIIMAMFVDIKFIFVAVVLIFLILPPILLFVYYFHALSPESRYSILEHHISMSEEGINIIYDGEDAHNPEFLAWSDISALLIGSDKIVYKLRKDTYAIIILPFSALSEQGKIISWINFSKKMLEKFGGY
jgi:hypothetical protein